MIDEKLQEKLISEQNSSNKVQNMVNYNCRANLQ